MSPSVLTSGGGCVIDRPRARCSAALPFHCQPVLKQVDPVFESYEGTGLVAGGLLQNRSRNSAKQCKIEGNDSMIEQNDSSCCICYTACPKLAQHFLKGMSSLAVSACFCWSHTFVLVFVLFSSVYSMDRLSFCWWMGCSCWNVASCRIATTLRVTYSCLRSLVNAGAETAGAEGELITQHFIFRA